MTKHDLALFGGLPLRTQPWSVEPMVDEDEERMVVAAIREKNFSRYIGSSAPDIETTLRMTSADALKLGDYWHYLGGRNVREFSANFAQVMDVSYAVPVNSATTGLSVALLAAGVGPGDEVIIPALSYTASASAVLLFNSIPVFVDVDPQTFCIDPDQVEKAITAKTKAILVVHLLGAVADMDRLMDIARRHGLKVIEDCAQAIGASWRGRKVGSIGDAGVFSFQQSKNIMTGEGGMITTSDPEVARRCRLIVNHGEVIFEDHHSPDDLAGIIGCNFRLTELCAALGIAQLRKLDAINEWRRRNADALRRELEGVPGIVLPPDQKLHGDVAVNVPHVFAALYDAEALAGVPRSVFIAALRAEGITVGTGYLRPMYANPTFLQRIAHDRDGWPWSASQSTVTYAHGMCPLAESLLNERFLWFYQIAHPSTEADMADVGAALRKVVAAKDALRAVDPADLGSLAAKAQGRIGTSASGKKG